jgi:predicted transcriptional regulator
MSRGLTEKQNDALRRTLAKLFKSGRYNQTSAAEAIGVTQSTISKFIKGEGGTSPQVAAKICEMAGESIESVLGEEFKRTFKLESPDISRPLLRPFSQLPGWTEARRAIEQLHPAIPAWVWDEVGQWCPKPQPIRVRPSVLYNIAVMVLDETARPT